MLQRERHTEEINVHARTHRYPLACTFYKRVHIGKGTYMRETIGRLASDY